jgi:hypothetical protein
VPKIKDRIWFGVIEAGISSGCLTAETGILRLGT